MGCQGGHSHQNRQTLKHTVNKCAAALMLIRSSTRTNRTKLDFHPFIHLSVLESVERTVSEKVTRGSRTMIRSLFQTAAGKRQSVREHAVTVYSYDHHYSQSAAVLHRRTQVTLSTIINTFVCLEAFLQLMTERDSQRTVCKANRRAGLPVAGINASLALLQCDCGPSEPPYFTSCHL